MSLNAILNTIYTSVSDGALRALLGFTDGPNCDGSGTYTVGYSGEVTYSSQFDINLIKNQGLPSEETLPATTSTLSPATAIDYIEPAWTVALVDADTVHLSIGAGSNYTPNPIIPFGTVVQTGTGWIDNLDSTYTHSGTVAGENRFLRNDGTLIEGQLYDIVFTKTATGPLTVVIGGPAILGNSQVFNGAGSFTATIRAESLSTVDAIRFVSSQDAETVLDISFSLSGVDGIAPQILTLTNCLDVGIISIASLTSSTSDILLSVAPTSAQAVTDAGGVVNGTVTFDSQGADCSAGGNITFTQITDYLTMNDSGQIVITVETVNACARDDAGVVSFSQGLVVSSNQQLLNHRSSTNALHGYIRSTTTNNVAVSPTSGSTQQASEFNGFPKGAFTEICYWWDSLEFGYLIDGANSKPQNMPATRSAPSEADIFDQIIIGANVGNAEPFLGTITSIVASNVSPFKKGKYAIKSFGIFGDSYALQAASGTSGARLDATVEGRLQALLTGRGINARVTLNGGHGGHTMFTNGANDLETFWTSDTTFLDDNPEVVICLAFNNDVTSSEANILNATTGTEAKTKEFLQACFDATATKKVVLCTAGSLIGDTNLDTAARRDNITLINYTILPAVQVWADANLAVGFLKIVNIESYSLGGNLHQGELNFVGNVTVAGTGVYNDRHPSGLGQVRIADLINSVI